MAVQYVERSLVIVRPRQPFADWANSVDDHGPRFNLDQERSQPNAYLVDNRNDSDELAVVLKTCWKDLFEEELCGWMRDPECWPAKRTRAMFEQWFDCEMILMVHDQGSEPIYGD